ncbi:hypothetical protein ABBQ38_014002 [Trebouxia sp. C0009 RCD-2024]
MAKLTDEVTKSISEYQAALQLADAGAEYNPGPWVVAKKISRILFGIWSQGVPAVWKIAYEEISGTVFLYGDPRTPHARTAGWFSQVLGPQIERALGPTALDQLDFSTGEIFHIPGWGDKMPDFAVISQSRRGSSLACFMLEVGYHNEQSMEAIIDEVCLWHGYGCPVIVGIKITDNTVDATAYDPRIEVLAKRKAMPDLRFHLGQGSLVPCTGPNTHVIEIPTSLLLSRASRSAIFPSKVNVLCIDLFPLQSKIRQWVLDCHMQT